MHINKSISKIVGSALVLTLMVGIGFTIRNNVKEAVPVEASVGSYSRDQSTYYTSAFSHKVTSSSYGTSLLNTLHELMYDSHQTYNTYNDLWDYTKYTDYDIDNPDNIILVYSRQSIDGTATASSWNREHIWCKSLSGGLYSSVSGSASNAGTDIHHLRPASTAYNSTRGNIPYGIVSTHNSTTQLGDTDCYYTSSVFEPADYIKGDVARILMYMYTHYSTEVSGTSTKSGALSITNIVNTSVGTAQAAWDLLMDWNELDPVDYSEMVRNNQACVYTGNFNPFIDHPEYARMIWDDSSSYQAGLAFITSYKTVSVGSNYTNTASAIGNVSSSGDITYTSDNPNVATVNSSGQVTGVSNGVARIKARATVNGVSKISYHFVKVGSGYTPKYTMNASGIVYTPTSASTARASATIGSETVSFSNTYTTDKYHTQLTNGKVATLTINNFPGTITSMILSMHSNQSSGSCSINITVGGSTYKSISTSSFSSIYGSYTQSYVPVDVTNSSASKKTGTIVITISCSANSIFFEKAIIDYSERSVTNATSITVSPSSRTLVPSEDLELSTSFTPSNTTLQTVTWSSSNTSVATVNKYGLVRAVAVGNATITATAKDGSGATGTTAITVSNSVGGDDPSDDPVLSSITLNTSGVQTIFTVGDTFTYSGLVVTANYSDSTSATVTPTSVSSPDMSTSGNKTITVSYTEGGITRTATYNITVNAVAAVITSISASVSKTYHPGDVITSDDITVVDNLDNEINDFTFVDEDYQFTYSDASSGGSATSKTFTNSISYSSFTCSLTVSVSREAYVTPSSEKDTITASDLSATSTSYVAFSDVSKTSDAVYAGQSAKNSAGAIQMRSTSPAGIVSTTSGGKVQSVKITVSSGNKTINVYGSNTAYASSTDLYDNSKKGTLVGSTSSTATITFDDSYSYVGIRSNSGAIYITSIEITWGTSETAKNVSNFIMINDTNGQCTTKLDQAITKLNTMSSSEKSSFNSSNDYVISTARTRLEAWAVHEGKTLSYEDGTFATASKAINPFIKETPENSISVIIIISLVGLSAIGGYFMIRKRKED